MSGDRPFIRRRRSVFIAGVALIAALVAGLIADRLTEEPIGRFTMEIAFDESGRPFGQRGAADIVTRTCSYLHRGWPFRSTTFTCDVAVVLATPEGQRVGVRKVQVWYLVLTRTYHRPDGGVGRTYVPAGESDAPPVFASHAPDLPPSRDMTILDGTPRRMMLLNSMVWYGAFLSSWIAFVGVRSGVRRLRRRTGCCPNCGYDLRGSPDRCPECGR